MKGNGIHWTIKKKMPNKSLQRIFSAAAPFQKPLSSNVIGDKKMAILLLLTGAAMGGLISWFITHKYYEKSSKELDELRKEVNKPKGGYFA